MQEKRITNDDKNEMIHTFSLIISSRVKKNKYHIKTEKFLSFVLFTTFSIVEEEE